MSIISFPIFTERDFYSDFVSHFPDIESKFIALNDTKELQEKHYGNSNQIYTITKLDIFINLVLALCIEKKIYGKTFEELIEDHNLSSVVTYLYCLRIDLLYILNTYYPTLEDDEEIIIDNICYYGVCAIDETFENMLINGTSKTITEDGVIVTYSSPVNQVYYILIPTSYANTLYKVLDIANDDVTQDYTLTTYTINTVEYLFCVFNHITTTSNFKNTYYFKDPNQQ